MKSVVEIIYDEALRALERQANSLDELRRRAAIVLAAVGVLAGLIGKAVLTHGVGVAEALALIFMAAPALLCVSVLTPIREHWQFVTSPTLLIEDFLDRPKWNDPAKLMRFLAEHFAKAYQDNKKALELPPEGRRLRFGGLELGEQDHVVERQHERRVAHLAERDLGREQVALLDRVGYRPCYILDSSPAGAKGPAKGQDATDVNCADFLVSVSSEA